METHLFDATTAITSEHVLRVCDDLVLHDQVISLVQKFCLFLPLDVNVGRGLEDL